MALKSRTELTNELDALKAKHDEFRALVAKTALEAKNENGWCDSGFAKALETLGLKDALPTARKLVTLVVDVELDHESDWDLNFMLDEDWAEAALEKIREDYMSAHELSSYSNADVPEN